MANPIPSRSTSSAYVPPATRFIPTGTLSPARGAISSSGPCTSSRISASTSVPSSTSAFTIISTQPTTSAPSYSPSKCQEISKFTWNAFGCSSRCCWTTKSPTIWIFHDATTPNTTPGIRSTISTPETPSREWPATMESTTYATTIPRRTSSPILPSTTKSAPSSWPISSLGFDTQTIHLTLQCQSRSTATASARITKSNTETNFQPAKYAYV